MSIKDLIAFYEKKATANDADDGSREDRRKYSNELKLKEHWQNEYTASFAEQESAFDSSPLTKDNTKEIICVKDRISEIDRINSKAEIVENMQGYPNFGGEMTDEIDELYENALTKEE